MTDTQARPIRVLFVCTGNSARSQIAEALLATVGGGRFEAASAGTDPKGVNPFTIRVLAEHGIDWGSATSDRLDKYLDRAWDYIITVCDSAHQRCPVFPGGGVRLHWSIEDPAEATGSDADKMVAFNRAFSDLSLRVNDFVLSARSAHQLH